MRCWEVRGWGLVQGSIPKGARHPESIRIALLWMPRQYSLPSCKPAKEPSPVCLRTQLPAYLEAGIGVLPVLRLLVDAAHPQLGPQAGVACRWQKAEWQQ